MSEDAAATSCRSIPRWAQVGVGLAILVGTILRWHHLGRLSLWMDEGYTAWAEDHSIAEILRLIRADTSPPLYYVLLHCWTSVMGRSETSLRGFSALMGTMQLPLVAAIAWRALKKPGATVAATWLFAVALLQIWYSQEARCYEMLSLCAAVMLYGVLRYNDSARGAARWLWLIGAAMTAGLYTHNMMLAMAPGFVGAWLILPSRQPMPRRLRDGVILAGGVLIAYLPWLATLASQFHRVNGGFWILRPTVASFAMELAELCGILHSWTWDRHFSHFHLYLPTLVPGGTVALLAASIAVGAATLRGQARRTLLGLAFLAIFPPLLVGGYSLFATPVFIVRVFIGCTIPMAVLMAGAMAWPESAAGKTIGAAATALILVLVTVNGLSFVHDQAKEDWRRLAQVVRGYPVVPHRLIVFVSTDCQLPFDYYYRRRTGEVESGAPHGFFDVDPPQTLSGVKTEADLDHLRDLVNSGGFDDCVLILSHAGYVGPDGKFQTGITDKQALAYRYFTSHFAMIDRFDLPDVRAIRFRLH